MIGLRPLIVLSVLLVTAGPGAAQTLRIYQIDVEQADAALLVMPNGKTLLIDSGKNNHGTRIQTVIKQAGVTQIDAFVHGKAGRRYLCVSRSRAEAGCGHSDQSSGRA